MPGENPWTLVQTHRRALSHKILAIHLLDRTQDLAMKQQGYTLCVLPPVLHAVPPVYTRVGQIREPKRIK